MEPETNKGRGMTDTEAAGVRTDGGDAKPKPATTIKANAPEAESGSALSEPGDGAGERQTPESPRAVDAAGDADSGDAVPGAGTKAAEAAPDVDAAEPSGSNGDNEAVHVAGSDGEEIQRVSFPPLRESLPEMPLGNLDSLRDITLDAEVELGNATLQIEDILKLGVGSVVELNQRVDEPVRLLINNNLYALGEVVVVGDKFGLRIHKLTHL